MNLNTLRYLVAAAETQNFRKAAELCLVSQPTLSIAISKLEAELGVLIFERHLNKIRPSAIGSSIIAQAKRVLFEAETLRDLARSAVSQLNSPLKIGGIYSLAPYIWPSLIEELGLIAPEMQLIIDEDYTMGLKKKLLHGELDAALIALPFSGPGIVSKFLATDELVVVLRADHRLAQQPEISEQDLSTAGLLLLGSGHCLRAQILQACPSCLNAPELTTTIAGVSLETLRNMVASGMGITVLPKIATQSSSYPDTLVYRPFKKNPRPQRRLALAWRASFPRTKAITALLDALSAAGISTQTAPA